MANRSFAQLTRTAERSCFTAATIRSGKPSSGVTNSSVKSAMSSFCTERDVILLYGLGLGYHVKPLLSRQNRPIFAVEPNSEVIDISRKLNPSFFDGGDVQVVTDWEEFKSAYTQSGSATIFL